LIRGTAFAARARLDRIKEIAGNLEKKKFEAVFED
jgi:hypothetical protein